MPRSYLTQQFLNYFDSADQRVRTYPNTLDAQLFNIAAVELEDLDLRYEREVNAHFVSPCPSLLDNRGIYFGARIPNTFVLPAGDILNKVEGLRNGNWITLPPYDDTLPTPAHIQIDTTRSAIPFDNPILFDLISSGTFLTSVTPAFTLPIPMPLTFWLEGLPASATIDVFIEGLAFPCSVWQKNRVTSSETISYSSEGLQTTRNVWSRIDSVTVRNLPTGSHLTCWHAPFNLPAVPDLGRPYIHPMFRDQQFSRYWQIVPGQLREVYEAGPLVGLNYVQSYSTPEVISAIVVEPNTYGLLAVSGRSLYYVDRREPLPGKLNMTAITSDPVYSINVTFDPTREGSTRYACIQALEHAHDSVIRAWRYVLQTPSGLVFAILPSGTFVTYSGGAGWSTGVPAEVSVPLTETGTYVFSVECVDVNNIVSADHFPYANLPLNTVKQLDISGIVPAVAGIAYDSRGRLWIWTGDFAVPVSFCYDAYVLDSSSMNLFLTDAFDGVRIS
jgi:hypothetical protein